MSKYTSALQKIQPQSPESPKTGKPETPQTWEPEVQNSGKPETKKVGASAGKKTRGREEENSGIPENVNEREKYSTILPSATVQALKLYAVRHRLKDWEVVDAALKVYLKDRE
ncbi:hypothetical protein [Deinococcus hohokamensis]|uniref:Uncharacterized protein n=1 Tax=Deinococcus hohokamensis TaxID=309883 RepID=A0ABV9ICC5_9DEIO